ncbi:MAG: hypothetical protein NC095_10190 [Muribaculum sp.]|nr:hypothetical protein [Muribaculum sp.]
MEMILRRQISQIRDMASGRVSMLIVTSLIMLTFLMPSAAQGGVAKEMLIERYTRQLKGLTTARDSIRVLYYLFDLSDRKHQNDIAWQIYATAGRAQDINSQMDMLRNLAVFNQKNDSIINILESLADNIPNEDARSATKTFIFNQQVGYKSRTPDDNFMSTMLLDSIVNSHNLQGKDVYDRIGLLYQMIQYIGTESEGSLFAECLDKYAELIDRLPESDYPLKNQFYTASAIFHSRVNGDQRRAIIYDKKLLKIMDLLQIMYHKQNRKYRNYDTNKFTCYRRIMSNFKVLSAKELEDTYDSLMMLYERNTDVKNTIDRNGLIHGYYHFAKGEYKEAMPYIKQGLQNASLSVYQRIKLNKMLIDASKALGDNQTYIKAMEDYIADTWVIDSMRSVTTQREIMLRNCISNTPLLQSADEEIHRRSTKGRDLAFIIVSSLLAAMLILYMCLYIKLKRTNRH